MRTKLLKVSTDSPSKERKLAIILAALENRKCSGSGRCVKEVRDLEDMLSKTGYEIIYVKDREITPIPLRSEHFEQTKDFIASAIDHADKNKAPLTGVLIWIIAHGKTELQFWMGDGEEDPERHMGHLFIETDERPSKTVNINAFIQDLGDIAKKARDRNQKLPILMNVQCCRGTSRAFKAGDLIFEETPKDMFVMYNSSIGELTSDNGTFINQWLGKYATSFRKEKLTDVAEELKNDVRLLNEKRQQPKIMENLDGRVINGVYIHRCSNKLQTLEDMTGASNDDNQITSRTRANTMTNADATLDLTSTPPSTAQAGDSRKRSASVRLSGALRESPQAKKRFSELDKDNSGSISPSDALEFSKGANEILRDEPVSNATIEAVQSKALEELKRNQLPLTYDKLCDVYEDAEKAVNAEDERRQHSPPEDLEQFRRDMDVQGKDVVETNRLKTERLRDHQEQMQSDISDHQMQTMTTREELESKMNELRRVQEEIRQERSSQGMLVNDGKFPACPAFTILLFLFIWLLLRQMAGDKATHSYPFH